MYSNWPAKTNAPCSSRVRSVRLAAHLTCEHRRIPFASTHYVWYLQQGNHGLLTILFLINCYWYTCRAFPGNHFECDTSGVLRLTTPSEHLLLHHRKKERKFICRFRKERDGWCSICRRMHAERNYLAWWKLIKRNWYTVMLSTSLLSWALHPKQFMLPSETCSDFEMEYKVDPAQTARSANNWPDGMVVVPRKGGAETDLRFGKYDGRYAWKTETKLKIMWWYEPMYLPE